MSWSLSAFGRKKGVATKERICTSPSSFSLFNVKQDLDLSLVASVLDAYVKSRATFSRLLSSNFLPFLLMEALLGGF